MTEIRIAVPASSHGRRAGTICVIVAAIVSICWAVPVCVSADARDAAPNSVLHLPNGDFLPGSLQDSDKPAVLRWKCPLFAHPFDFALGGVAHVTFPIPREAPKPTGDYCFELAGGDVVYGALTSFTADEAELDVAHFGHLHVRRDVIRRIWNWRDGADLIYTGPSGLIGWRESGLRMQWKEEAGQLFTEIHEASVSGDFHVPTKACIEFDISWRKKADFEFTIGTNPEEKTGPQAFRFEVWENDIVILRETGREADVASLQKIKPGTGRISLQAYLDQEQGRAYVFSSSGQPLGELQVAGESPKNLTGIRLSNKRGDVRLERLRIGRWNGEAPTAVKADKARIHHADGTLTYGQVKEFRRESRTFIVANEMGDIAIEADRIRSLFLSPPIDVPPRPVRTIFQDGVRVSGDLQKVTAGEIHFTSPGIKEPLRAPLKELHSLVAAQVEAAAGEPKGRLGRLEAEGLKIRGCLTDGRQGSETSCLVWQPVGSTTSSPLRAGISGRVIYQEPPPVRPAPVEEGNKAVKPQVVVRNRVGADGAQLRTTQVAPSRAPRKQGSRRTLHLRTGDTIPCEVERIDEKGVTFTTPLSDATFVASTQVKAIEFEDKVPDKLNKVRRERLLTLPRMQKDSPPTHLIMSTNGDILRARLIEMDETNLKLEIRLEDKELPRDRVARIIWLHADELDVTKKPQNDSDPLAGTYVQALQGNGNRLTFFAGELAAASLSGKSDLLGVCRVDLDQVDQLLIGDAIEEAASLLAFQQWKLKNAEEPKAALEGNESSDGVTSGLESALVGKPAPDFGLDLVDGKRFQLSEQRDKVVVLDFWASWCGPCMQAMPQIDQVVKGFDDQRLRLVAVNLLETPERITATLKRLNLETTVALDKSGKVAEQYGAHNIPQTVVIDGQGKVARVFIGVGPHFAEQLHDAIDGVLNPDKPKPAADTAPSKE